VSDHTTKHGFGSTLFTIAGALLIWLGTFTFVYVFAALACARGFADVSVGGLPLVATVTALTILVAGVASTGVLIYVRRRVTGDDPNARFLRFVAAATAGLAFVALVLLALPALLTPACSG
jgi:hypothetical protein